MFFNSKYSDLSTDIETLNSKVRILQKDNAFLDREVQDLKERLLALEKCNSKLQSMLKMALGLMDVVNEKQGN